MNDEDLRDLFAGMAMQSTLATFKNTPIEYLAQRAYAIADAMIKEKHNVVRSA